MIEFTILGVPQPQGSKTRSRSGHMYEANKNLQPWRDAAMSRVVNVVGGHGLPTFTGPVAVAMTAYFPRPKSHYGSGRNVDQLKDGAPSAVATKPDLDKLQRALGDVLTQSGMVKDDSLIVHWTACKRYGLPARMEVRVSKW